jgi:hypothetical protein
MGEVVAVDGLSEGNAVIAVNDGGDRFLRKRNSEVAV